MSYIKSAEIVNHLNITKGDTLFISSGISKLAKVCKENNDIFDGNEFIELIQKKIGPEGTLLFPTYNWSFCQGKPFNYYETPSETGTLSQIALDRADFERTRHPIYSFAVWGKDKDYLCSLTNQSSFGHDSPFAHLHKVNAKNLIIDVKFQNSFTFVHYVEEQVGNIHYRYMKDFNSVYIDRDGSESDRSYSMLVRDLDLDVINLVDPYEPLFIETGFESINIINSIFFKTINLGDVFDIIKNDILNNKSRMLCSYIGQ